MIILLSGFLLLLRRIMVVSYGMENTMNRIFRISSVVIIIENFRSKNSKRREEKGGRVEGPRKCNTNPRLFFSPLKRE